MVNNSCGGRGCEYNYILPNDGRFNLVYARMLQVEHDIKAMVPISQFGLDKKLAKKGQMEAVYIETIGVVRILPISMDSFNMLFIDISKHRNKNDYELRTYISNN
jgi:hypothetical protein